MEETNLPMDIFSLPEVFLRDLMKTMTIKDRLRLRLTCRAFEELVANTHAGYFYDGRIIQSCSSTLSFHLGLANFKDIQLTEDTFEDCVRLRKRLFSGIEFDYFCFNLNNILSLEFISEFTNNFKIAKLSLFVDKLEQLELFLQLIVMFPMRKHILRLAFFPAPDLLMSLPPLDELNIHDFTERRGETSPWQIGSILFFNLLSKVRILVLDNVAIDLDDCERTVKIVAVFPGTKFVRVQLSNSIITSWLQKYNINQTTQEGFRFGDFEVLNVPETKRRPESLKLRYTHPTHRHVCYVSIDGSVWDGNSRSRMSLYTE